MTGGVAPRATEARADSVVAQAVLADTGSRTRGRRTRSWRRVDRRRRRAGRPSSPPRAPHTARREIVGLAGLEGRGRTSTCGAPFRRATGRGQGRIDLRGQGPARRSRSSPPCPSGELHRRDPVKGRARRADLGAPRVSAFARYADAEIRLGRDQDAITTLSGGNQQKVVIARPWRATPGAALNDPTRGVDIGAKRDIYALLRELPRRAWRSSCSPRGRRAPGADGPGPGLP